MNNNFNKIFFQALEEKIEQSKSDFIKLKEEHE